MEVDLVSHRIARLDMNNDLKNSCKMQLENMASIHINYDLNTRIAEAELKEIIRPRNHIKQFYIELTIKGIFLLSDVKNDVEKEVREMHVKCYNELFPFAKQLLSLLSIDSGIYGLTIRKNPIRPETIKFISQTGNGGGGKIVEFRTDL